MDNYEPIPLPDKQDLTDEVAIERIAEYYQFIRGRHSVRNYSDRPVPRKIIETAIRAAGTAPSGANHQPWHFVCVSDPATKRRIEVPPPMHELGQGFYGNGVQHALNLSTRAGRSSSLSALSQTPPDNYIVPLSDSLPLAALILIVLIGCYRESRYCHTTFQMSYFRISTQISYENYFINHIEL